MKMPKPTRTEINKQIQTLRKMKPNVRRHSLFGDNYHDAIEAQVRVMKENMSADEINDEFEADNTRRQAFQARLWLDGELLFSDDLVAQWRESMN